MRKIRKLSLFGILGVVICALIFIGISSLEANSIGQKPDKPGKPDKPPGNGEPEATWAVQIPETSLNLKGMYKDDAPFEYVNNGNDIIVNVEKKEWMAPGKNKARGFFYCFCFKLVNQTDINVQFSGLSLYEYTKYPENGALCAFPGAFPGYCGSYDPSYCMECFLNQYHPYSNSESEDYDHVYIKFWVYGYDIENMKPGDKYQLGSGNWTSSSSDRIRIKTGYTPVNTCSRSEPDYHDIICQKYADGLLNIWIERVSENKWQIYGNVDYLPVYETYCIEEKLKGWVSKTVTTLEAKGNFSFIMDWIKNPQ